MKSLILLLFFNYGIAQKYEFKEIFLRDYLGKFLENKRSGTFEISGTKILLFDQELEVKSKSYCFNEKGVSMGIMYGCSDGVFWYTILVTNGGMLYFNNKSNEMFRIKLIKVNK